jgi:hypothetical protein
LEEFHDLEVANRQLFLVEVATVDILLDDDAALLEEVCVNLAAIFRSYKL